MKVAIVQASFDAKFGVLKRICLLAFASVVLIGSISGQTFEEESFIRAVVTDAKFTFSGTVNSLVVRDKAVEIITRSLSSGSYKISLTVKPDSRAFQKTWEAEFEAEIRKINSWTTGIFHFTRDRDRESKLFARYLESATYLGQKDSKPVPLISRDRKAVLIVLYATWVGPFRTQIPTLNSLRHDYSSKDLDIIAINADDESKEDVATFVRLTQSDFTFGWENGALTKTFVDFTQFGGIPLAVLYSNGTIVSVYRGAASSINAAMVSDVRRVLGER